MKISKIIFHIYNIYIYNINFFNNSENIHDLMSIVEYYYYNSIIKIKNANNYIYFYEFKSLFHLINIIPSIRYFIFFFIIVYNCNLLIIKKIFLNI